jgi:hypothetical protein
MQRFFPQKGKRRRSPARDDNPSTILPNHLAATQTESTPSATFGRGARNVSTNAITVANLSGGGIGSGSLRRRQGPIWRMASSRDAVHSLPVNLRGQEPSSWRVCHVGLDGAMCYPAVEPQLKVHKTKKDGMRRMRLPF